MRLEIGEDVMMAVVDRDMPLNRTLPRTSPWRLVKRTQRIMMAEVLDRVYRQTVAAQTLQEDGVPF
jgi:hypothetical protein